MEHVTHYHETFGDYRTEKFVERPVTKPLYNLQSSLPRLPIPTLEETFVRYLASAKPVASPEEYKRTVAAAQEFLQPGGLGAELQSRLVQRAKDRHDSSWLAEWWNKVAYLLDPGPTPFFVSYFYYFADSPKAGIDRTQTRRAAVLLSAALMFRKHILKGTLPPARLGRKGPPLCSAPYKYMFNACRVPGQKADSVRLYPPAGNHHILVIRRNRFFIVHVTNAEGDPLSVHEIQHQLQAVIEQAGTRGEGEKVRPVGVLTSLGRREWARAREQLVADGNEALLERAEGAALALCLDESAPQTRAEVARALWHGDGRNRHFDKSVQIVVFANGKAGLVGEHSMMDGMPTVRLADFMHKKTMVFSSNAEDNAESSERCTPVPVTPPRPLDMALSPASLRNIATAESAFDRLVHAHELEVLMFPGYGSDLIKSFKMSPDGFVQMALQLAIFKMTGEVWATYEPAQVRKFLHGRTACVRSLSTPAKAWVEAMEDDGDRRPTERRLTLLRKAIEAHIEYSQSATQGKDVDRHLLGLSLVKQKGESCPLFDDPVFNRSKRWRVSTSHLTNDMIECWGWGEVVPDGVGVAYSIRRDSIVFNVTCLRRPERWAPSLCYNLQEALLDMRALCRHQAMKISKL